MDGQDIWPSFFIFSKIIFSKTVTILREIVTSFCIIYRYFCTKTTNTDISKKAILKQLVKQHDNQ